MTQERVSIHGQWSSRWIFVLAATGAAVGLGNVWKFPYITGQNGGGAFVLVYLVCVAVIGVPLLMAEIFLGRRGRANPANAVRDVALDSDKSRYWQVIGWVSVLSGFLILSYYSVIAGWAMDYIVQAMKGTFSTSSPEQITQVFDRLMANPSLLVFWHSSVMIITIFIIAQGIRLGIEKAVYFMFPSMILLLLVTVFYSADSGYFSEGLSFLFKPDFSKLTSEGVLVALGHAFFTLSIATGSIMMYGAYLPKDASVAKGAIYIAASDTLVALLAGIAIFPIVFANHLEPGAGPGLIFKTLPIAFGQMPYGDLFATLFFIMLVFAALTSAISLLEPTVALLMERYNLSRKFAAMLSGFGIWLLGLGSIFSFNHWSNFKIFGKTYFEAFDYFTSNILLPLGGLFVAIFAAWVVKKSIVQEELHMNSRCLRVCWDITMRYIAPVAITVIFLDFMGIINV